MASSEPATSPNVTFGVSFETSLARDLPNCMTRLPPPCMEDMRNQKMMPMMRNGSRIEPIDSSQFGCGTSSVHFVPLSRRPRSPRRRPARRGR